MPDARRTGDPRVGQLADEQAALLRVARLVACGVNGPELFKAVSVEVAGLYGADAAVGRFEPDGSGVIVVGLSEGIHGLTIGSHLELDGFLAPAEVRGTGRPARSRCGGSRMASGPIAEVLRQNGPVSGISAPIVLEGKPWGVIGVVETGNTPPPDAEERLRKFTELVGTAIASAESRAELSASEERARELAREQAALRRVATLLAEGPNADELFTAVAREVADVVGIPVVGLLRFDEDRTATMVGITGDTSFTVGSRWPVEDEGLAGMILATGRSARKEDYSKMPGPVGAAVRADRMTTTVGTPIVVEGSVWGFMVGAAKPGGSIPNGTEERLARFTELVATAIANAESRAELAASEARAHGLAAEQAALRRVATLVAEGATADEVFSAVTEGIEEVLDIPVVTICRCEADGFLVIRSNGMPGFPTGSRWPWDVPSLPGLIYQTGRPARIDDFTKAEGLNAAARDTGIKAAVGVPVVVGGTVWGSICAATTTHEPLPPDVEERLGRFRALVATSISNTIMREELAASRARIVAAADDARRRIERDLHDGAQQRLVTLAVALRRAEGKVPAELHEVRAEVARVADGLATAVEELRELSRGIHPSILAEEGLPPALKALGRRSPVRVKLDLRLERRLPDHVEVAAYYTVSEALTNAAKHASALRVWVSLRVDHDVLLLSIQDDGTGGADASRGSGLTGLRDRIEALGGKFQIESPRGSGTSIEVRMPIGEPIDRNSGTELPLGPMESAESLSVSHVRP